tara:strand:+ start:650 stop:979 length:330 start_codon:yes stop_codon:yes gene_type:complete
MENIEEKWKNLLSRLQDDFEDELTLKSILFLIGVQELSQGIRNFDKEEKTYLLHIAVCKLLAPYGYYKFKMIDEDGWPHWEESKKVEKLSATEQKRLIKKSILKYFENY